MCGEKGLPEHVNDAGALEAAVDAPTRHVPDKLVDGLPTRLGLDEIGDAHLLACTSRTHQKINKSELCTKRELIGYSCVLPSR